MIGIYIILGNKRKGVHLKQINDLKRSKVYMLTINEKVNIYNVDYYEICKRKQQNELRPVIYGQGPFTLFIAFIYHRDKM